MLSEFLSPLIDRVFGIMDRKGLLDDAPEVLKDRDIDVQYSSMIARAQRQNEAQAILRTIEQAAPFISADPSVLDNFDGDKALIEFARINNFPKTILRSKEEVAKIREDRAEQVEAAKQQEDATQTAQNIAAAGPGLAALQKV